MTDVFQHVAHDLQAVSLQAQDGNVEVIHSTDEHPYFVEAKGWVGAADRVVGDRVRQPDGSSLLVIANADDKRPEGVLVFNFAVEGNHTYFVEDGAGENDWAWVHNRCGPVAAGLGGDALAEQAKSLANHLGSRARNHRTVAVAHGVNDAGDEITIVVSSSRYLTKSQQPAATANGLSYRTGYRYFDEALGRFRNMHAEQAALRRLIAEGFTPTGVGASRQFCEECLEALKNAALST